MVWAAISDLRAYIIPNRVCLAVAGLYPAYVLALYAAGGPPVAWAWSLLCALIVFVGGVALFAIGAMGGGDVKLLSAVTLWAGPDLVFPFVFVTALAGAALAVIFALRLCLADAREQADGTMTLGVLTAGIFRLRHAPLMKLVLPYGVAIAGGGLFVSFRLMVG